MWRCAGLLAIVASAGCDHGPTDVPDAPTHGTPIAADPPVAHVEPTAEPGAALPAAITRATVPSDAPSFTVVAQRSSERDGAQLVLQRTQDGHLFAVANFLLFELAPDGSITHDAAWVRGIDIEGFPLELARAGMTWWDAIAMGGSWPGGAYIVLQEGSASRGYETAPLVYRRTNGRWSAIATHRGAIDVYPRSFGTWKDGSLLALRGFTPRFTGEYDETGPPAAQVRAFRAAVAREKKLVVLRGKPKAPAFGARDVHAFASLPSGEIFAIIDERGTSSLLHFDATGKQQAMVMPGATGRFEQMSLSATARDRVWAFGGRDSDAGTRGYLAHFDGTTWREVPTECVEPIASLSIDSAGSAVFVCELDRRPDDRHAALLRVRAGVIEELPLAIDPGLVVANAPDDIWVVSNAYRGPTQLLHTGTTRYAPLEIPNTVVAIHTLLEWAEPRPVDRTCEHAWIPISTTVDRKAIAAKLDGEDEGWFADVIDARVQGRVETGIDLRSMDRRGTPRFVKSVVAILGSAAGTPTCNERPDVDGPTEMPGP